MNTKGIFAIRRFIRTSLLVVPFALLTSCAVIQPRERVTNTLFLDYRPYVSAGFHISPDPYNQPHNVLGELMIEVYPAIKPFSKYKEQGESKFSDGIYSNRGLSANRVFKEVITSEELLEIAVSKALDIGANGIANFEAKVIYNTTYLKNGSTIQTISHYEIKGLCIDRK